MLQDEVQQFIGIYDYMGLSTKNDLPIYNRTHEWQDGRKTHSSYLFKDWQDDERGQHGKIWKVVVSLPKSLYLHRLHEI